MVAGGMADQILFMSLKCTQTKMFAPEPRQHSEDRAAAGISRVFRNEQRIEYNLKIQGVLFAFFLSFFSTFLLSLVVIGQKKKTKMKAIYELILLAHKVLLSSEA